MTRNATLTRLGGAVTAAGALLVGLLGVQAGSAAAQSGSAAAQPPNASEHTNPYSPAYGHPYRHGVVPTRARQAQMNAHSVNRSSSTSQLTLGYGGGVANTDGTVVGVTSGSTPKVYLVFWGSGWGNVTNGTTGENLTFSNDPDNGAPYIENLFKGLGTDGELWSATMTQYCDGSVAYGATSCPSGSSQILYPSGGGVLAGVWYDSSVNTTTTTSATQIAQEAVNAAAHFGNTTAASNRDAQYDILSPTGANPDNYLNSGFCAWHDYTGDGYNVNTTVNGTTVDSYLAFTNMPYVMDVGASCGMDFVNSGSQGTLDGYSIVNGHEYAETITDQFPAGGWTNLTSGSYSGEENGDECAWISSGAGAAGNVTMASGTFAMQSTWSNHDNSCVLDTDQPFSSSGSGTGGTTNTVTVSTPLAQLSYLHQAASLQMTATDTSGANTFTWSAAGLPPGLGINTSSGLISGTPRKTGTYSVTVTATDGTGASGSTGFSWQILK